MIRRALLVTALTALATFGGLASASARTPYDGLWSVIIFTRAGNCDSGLRYRLRIANGYIFSEGGGFDARGRVTNNGSISVVVSQGGQSAHGSGRLNRRGGSGRWQTASRECAGNWTAERFG